MQRIERTLRQVASQLRQAITPDGHDMAWPCVLTPYRVALARLPHRNVSQAAA